MRRTPSGRPENRADTVTASEIAAYVYCPEAWRLEALGNESSNRPAREAGTLRHKRKAWAEFTAGLSIALGRTLIGLGLVCLVLLWLLR